MRQLACLVVAAELATVGAHSPTCDQAEGVCDAEDESLIQHASQYMSRRSHQSKGFPERWPVGKYSWDGESELEATRTETRQAPGEYLFRLPRPDTVDAVKGAFIPFGKKLTAKYIRDFFAAGSFEFGVVNWVWDKQAWSLMSPEVVPNVTGVVAAAPEKMHTLTQGGEWSTQSLDRVRKEQEERFSDFTDTVAKALRVARSSAIDQWLLGSFMGSQLLAVSMDDNVLADIANFSLSESDDKQHIRDRLNRKSTRLTNKDSAYSDSYGDGTVIGGATGGMYFQGHPKLVVEEDGMWLPLDTTLPAMRAEGRYVPLQTFGVMSGVIMARYDEKIDSIDIYMGAASWSNIPGPDVTPGSILTKSALYVGPFAGAQRPVPVDGRVAWALKPPPHFRPMVKMLLGAVTKMPVDYSYFDLSQSDACPPARLNATMAMRGAIDWPKLASAKLPPLKTMEALKVISESADCQLDWLKGFPSDGHGYGFLESALHFTSVMEFAGNRIPTTSWNEFSLD